MTENLLNHERRARARPWQMPNVGPERLQAMAAENEQLIKSAAEIKQHAYQEGHQEGYIEGVLQAQADVAAHIASLKQLLLTLQNPLDKAEKQLEHEVLELAVSIARRVVQEELRINPELILNVIKEALSALPISNQTIDIMVNPEDATLLSQHLDALDVKSFTIKVDVTLKRGECRLASQVATVDATVESRIDKIVATLFSHGTQGE